MTMQLLTTAVIASALAMPSPAGAQGPLQTTLDVVGFPLTFNTPTAVDFAAGFIMSSTPITFTVDAQTGTTAQRTATVSIRCAAPCPAQGTKSGSSLHWRRADLGNWNTLTTVDALVESRLMFRGLPPPGSNDPWSNSLYFQFLLDWMADVASATPNRFDVIMTLTVTAP